MAPLVALLFSLLVPLLLRRLLRSFSGTPPSTPSTATMNRSQARAILGVADDATPEQIQAAYVALMQKLHPDVGGNVYLASQINQARDTLLNH